MSGSRPKRDETMSGSRPKRDKTMPGSRPRRDKPMAVPHCPHEISRLWRDGEGIRGYAYQAAKRGGNMNMKHIWGDPTTSSVPPMAGLKKRPIKDWEEVVG